MSSIYPNSGGAAMRPCMRCGAPLAPNQSQCSRCGLYNPPPQNQQFGQFNQMAQGGASFPQNPQTSGQRWPNASGSASSWGPVGQNATGMGGQRNNTNTLFPGQNQAGRPSQQLQHDSFSSPHASGTWNQRPSSFNYPSSPFQSNNPQQSAIRPSFYDQRRRGAAQTNVPGQNRQHGWAQRGRGHAPAVKNGDSAFLPVLKQGTSPWVYGIIVFLLIVLIGFGTIAALSIFRSSNGGASSSSAVTIVTPGGTPLFGDSFQNNNAGWDLSPATGATVTLSAGKLVLTSNNHTLFPELLPQKTFDNFRLDVDAGLTQGNVANGYGIYIRASATQDSNLGLYYRFEIYGNGDFAIYKGTQDASGDTKSTLVKEGASPAIYSQPQLNHLTILANGSQIILQINSTSVYTLTDNSYKSGSVALFVSNVSNVAAGAQATFERLAVFPGS